MSLHPYSTPYDVTGINDHQKQRILDFLQGAVYCWCKNRPDEWFSIRNLMGGENFDWTDTPMEVLYNKHIENRNEQEAIKLAGQDSGKLLKRVIAEDPRSFETSRFDQVRNYRWVRG